VGTVNISAFCDNDDCNEMEFISQHFTNPSMFVPTPTPNGTVSALILAHNTGLVLKLYLLYEL